MFCPTCGAQVDDDCKFCTTCGSPMGEMTQQAVPIQATPVQAVPVQAAPAQAAPVQAAPAQVAPVQAAPAQAAPMQAAPVQAAPVQAAPVQAAPVQAAPMQASPPVQQAAFQGTYVNPIDHTAEFSAKDISDNKVMAMLPYLMGTVGAIIALLASRESAYTAFHVRQAMKITVVSMLFAIVMLLLSWTLLVPGMGMFCPIVGGVCFLALFVIRIICFFNVCSGKAKEPPIIYGLGFLR